MNLKSYPTKKTMPQRTARKRARRDVFLANRKMGKLAREARRLERKSTEIQEQIEE